MFAGDLILLPKSGEREESFNISLADTEPLGLICKVGYPVNR